MSKAEYEYTCRESDENLNSIVSAGFLRAGRGMASCGTVAYKLAERYFSGKETVRTVDRAIILEIGHNVGDGFIGIKYRLVSTQIMIELVNGSRGQVFLRVFDKFPTKEEFLFAVRYDLHRSCIAIARLEGKVIRPEVLDEFPELESLEKCQEIKNYQERLEKCQS